MIRILWFFLLFIGFLEQGKDGDRDNKGCCNKQTAFFFFIS